MSEPSNAAFLSYASQDAAAARRICDALRAAGVEVWFDQNELVGGDAWDKKIRTQIRDCALFLPVISANTQSRLEGYFRLEWKLAEDRSHLMAKGKPFLVPVVVDDTSERDAHVPDAFLAVQWTRLPAGETTAAFCARVQRLLGGETHSGTRERFAVPPASRETLTRSATKKGFPEAAWSFAAVAALAVAGYFFLSRKAPIPEKPAAPVSPNPSPAAAQAADKSAPADKSLVVFPLENLSPDPENAFFTDGMHYEITNTLSRIPDLKVISRDSALALKDSTASLAAKAQKVGVANVITGSVQRAGNDVRISLELRRASDEALLWTETFNEKLGAGVLAIQSKVAEQIARVLQAREKSGTYASARALAKDARAYDLFLQARRQFETERLNEDSTLFSQLEEALRLDPGFMPAAALLSTAHTRVHGLFNRSAATRARHAAEAKRWADKAAQLMPGGAGDGPLAAYYIGIERDYQRSLTHAENLIRALPNEATGHDVAASALGGLGRQAEGATRRGRALELDPLNGLIWGNQVAILTRLRRTPEALAALARWQELLPAARTKYLTESTRYRLLGEVPQEGTADSTITSYLWRMRKFDELLLRLERLLQTEITDELRFVYSASKARTHLRLGQRVPAMQAAEQALELARRPTLDPDDAPEAQALRRAHALAILGRGDEALEAARRSIAAAASPNQILLRWDREYELAEICATLNRPRECVELLARLLRLPSNVTVPTLRVNPNWDNVREDPAFKALLADPKNSAPL